MSLLDHSLISSWDSFASHPIAGHRGSMPSSTSLEIERERQEWQTQGPWWQADVGLLFGKYLAENTLRRQTSQVSSVDRVDMA